MRKGRPRGEGGCSFGLDAPLRGRMLACVKDGGKEGGLPGTVFFFCRVVVVVDHREQPHGTGKTNATVSSATSFSFVALSLNSWLSSFLRPCVYTSVAGGFSRAGSSDEHDERMSPPPRLIRFDSTGRLTQAAVAGTATATAMPRSYYSPAVPCPDEKVT